MVDNCPSGATIWPSFKVKPGWRRRARIDRFRKTPAQDEEETGSIVSHSSNHIGLVVSAVRVT
jgi:hypothetical protein